MYRTRRGFFFVATRNRPRPGLLAFAVASKKEREPNVGTIPSPVLRAVGGGNKQLSNKKRRPVRKR